MISYNDINNLEELSLIAGTKYDLTFSIYQNGELISLIGATVNWILSHYGSTEEVLTKAGTILLTTMSPFGTSSLGVEIILEPEDTINLRGKFIQQLSITDFDGSTFIPVQGVVTILPAIGTVVVP